MNGSGRRPSGESGRGGKDCCLFTKEKYKTVIWHEHILPSLIGGYGRTHLQEKQLSACTQAAKKQRNEYVFCFVSFKVQNYKKNMKKTILSKGNFRSKIVKNSLKYFLRKNIA